MGYQCTHVCVSVIAINFNLRVKTAFLDDMLLKRFFLLTFVV